MRLSKEERKEMLVDGRSLKRRKEFIQSQKLDQKDLFSLDEFIKFLKAIQKIFSPLTISHRPTITKLNKL